MRSLSEGYRSSRAKETGGVVEEFWNSMLKYTPFFLVLYAGAYAILVTEKKKEEHHYKLFSRLVATQPNSLIMSARKGTFFVVRLLDKFFGRPMHDGSKLWHFFTLRAFRKTYAITMCYSLFFLIYFDTLNNNYLFFYPRISPISSSIDSGKNVYPLSALHFLNEYIPGFRFFGETDWAAIGDSIHGRGIYVPHEPEFTYSHLVGGLTAPLIYGFLFFFCFRMLARSLEGRIYAKALCFVPLFTTFLVIVDLDPLGFWGCSIAPSFSPEPLSGGAECFRYNSILTRSGSLWFTKTFDKLTIAGDLILALGLIVSSYFLGVFLGTVSVIISYSIAIFALMEMIRGNSVFSDLHLATQNAFIQLFSLDERFIAVKTNWFVYGFTRSEYLKFLFIILFIPFNAIFDFVSVSVSRFFFKRIVDSAGMYFHMKYVLQDFGIFMLLFVAMPISLFLATFAIEFFVAGSVTSSPLYMKVFQDIYDTFVDITMQDRGGEIINFNIEVGQVLPEFNRGLWFLMSYSTTALPTIINLLSNICFVFSYLFTRLFYTICYGTAELIIEKPDGGKNILNIDLAGRNRAILFLSLIAALLTAALLSLLT
jgi:hypothetical protein